MTNITSNIATPTSLQPYNVLVAAPTAYVFTGDGLEECSTTVISCNSDLNLSEVHVSGPSESVVTEFLADNPEVEVLQENDIYYNSPNLNIFYSSGILLPPGFRPIDYFYKTLWKQVLSQIEVEYRKNITEAS